MDIIKSVKAIMWILEHKHVTIISEDNKNKMERRRGQKLLSFTISTKVEVMKMKIL